MDQEDGEKFLGKPVYFFIEKELVPLVKEICKDLNLDDEWTVSVHVVYQKEKDLCGSDNLIRIYRALKAIKKATGHGAAKQD
jgi:hypothetical protein